METSRKTINVVAALIRDGKRVLKDGISLTRSIGLGETDYR